MKINQKRSGIKCANKLAIFASSLLVSAVALYLYSPVIGSHADSSIDIEVAAAINPIASLSLDVSELNFNITPTAYGAFDSKSITTTVKTNSTGGYELYFSSTDNETDMKSTNLANEHVVSSSFDNTITSSEMPVNTWGYSLNNTDFSKIPALSSQTAIKNIDHHPTTEEKTTTVYIGTKISTSLPSGLYRKDIVFSVLAHATPEPPDDIFSINYMQEMTPAICNATTTPDYTADVFDWDGSHRGDENYVPRTVLTDSRDGKTYLVSKLSDGNCWMSQNLALELTEDVPITASKNDGTTMTVTPNNTTQTSAGRTWPQTDENWRSYKPIASESYYQAGTTMSSEPSGAGHSYDWEKAGNYYNWYAATAGTGMDDADASICPKGWRLPSDESDYSYHVLIANYYRIPNSTAGAEALRAAPLNFVLSGDYSYYTGEMDLQESSGFYWTSTGLDGGTRAYDLTIREDGMNPLSVDLVGDGFTVRCVAI